MGSSLLCVDRRFSTDRDKEERTTKERNMCRAGGRRCHGHVEQDKTNALARLKKWREALPVREAAYQQHQTSKNLERLEAAKRNLTIEEEKVAAFTKELEKIKDRGSRDTGSGLSEFASVNLKGSEWEHLAAEAEEAGVSRSELVRERLASFPVITPVGAATLPRPEYKGDTTIGRHPTNGVTEGDYKRGARGVRYDETNNARLKDEAAIFGLETSDYMRCLVMGLDPRSIGHHHKQEKADSLREKIEDLENPAELTPQTVERFWHEKVQQVRARYSN